VLTARTEVTGRMLIFGQRHPAELGFAVASGALLDTIVVRFVLVTAPNLDLAPPDTAGPRAGPPSRPRTR